MKISILRPNPDNPRKISKDQLERLKRSLQEFSKMMELRPIVYDPDTMHVLGGNQRLAAIKAMGMKEIPDNWAIPAANLTESEKKEFVLRDNVQMGEWDVEMLNDKFPEFNFEELGLDLDFNTRTTPASEDNYIPPENIETDIVLGDVITIGPHIIICGDSCDPKTLEMLSAPKADMVFTDPPYNVNYKGNGKNTSKHIANDNMSSGAFQAFLTQAFQNLANAAKPDAPWYVCYSQKSQREFEEAMNSTNMTIKSQIVWVKPSVGPGMSDYRPMHELMFYAMPGGAKSKFYGDRSQPTVWKEEYTDAEIAKAVRAAQQKAYNGQSTVWFFGRDSNYVHPTQKPILLCAKAIENSSARGDAVFDAFLGSGSTLVAAHQTGRVCYGVELDPKYCQAICDRMRLQDPNLEIKIQHIE